MKRTLNVIAIGFVLFSLSTTAFSDHRRLESTVRKDNGKTRYQPREQGWHHVEFADKARLSFDSTRVRSDRVSVAKKKEYSKDAGKSVIGLEISVAPRVASGKDFPAPGQSMSPQGAIYHFEPEGLEFDTAAALTLPYACDASEKDEDVNVYYYNKETRYWEIVPVISRDTTNKTITACITHFSDYVAGTSSFTIDESGTLGGGNTVQDVDPNTGAVLLKNTEFYIPARGLPLSLTARFSSDYLYKRYLPVYTKTQSAAATFVPEPNANYPIPQTDISSGWTYELPYCLFGASNQLVVTLPGGKKLQLDGLLPVIAALKPGSAIDQTDCRITKPSRSFFQLYYPEAKVSLDVSCNTKHYSYWVETGPSSSYEVTGYNAWVNSLVLRFEDGSYATFPASGFVNTMYDASGKNYIKYTYESGCLRSMTHSDGRCVKLVSLCDDSDKKKGVVYVLSDTSVLTTLNVADEFLARRVLNSDGTTASFDRLTTKTHGSATSWPGVTEATEPAYYDVEKSTTYEYPVMNSTVTGNTMIVKDPGSGTRKYTFSKSFFRYASYYYTYACSCSEASWTNYESSTLYYYKPKVAEVLVGLDSAFSIAQKKQYTYTTTTSIPSENYTHSGSQPYDASTYTLVSTAVTADCPINPSKTTIVEYSVSGSTTKIIKREEMEYSYSGNDYMGVGRDYIFYYLAHETQTEAYKSYSAQYQQAKAQYDSLSSGSIFDQFAWATKLILKVKLDDLSAKMAAELAASHWVFESETRRAFVKKYNFYNPEVETRFVGDSVNARWTVRYAYDDFGRMLSETDSRIDSAKAARTYEYVVPTSQSGADLYARFGLVLRTSVLKKSGSFFTTSYTYDSSMNLATRTTNATTSGETTSFTYDPATNNLVKIEYPEKNCLELTYGTGVTSSYIVKDQQCLTTNSDGSSATNLAHVFTYDLRGRTTSVMSKIVDSSGADIDDSSCPITTYFYAYDGCNRVTSKSRSSNGSTVVLYNRAYDDDVAHPSVTTTNAKGYQTVDAYDAYYRRVGTASYRPDTQFRDASYDGFGRVAVAERVLTYDADFIDKEKEERTFDNTAGTAYYYTSYAYDEEGRLSTISAGNSAGTSALLQAITYEYSSSGETRTVKNYRDASDYNQTVTQSDWLGRATTVTNYGKVNGADELTTKYGYDYTGEKLTETLPNNQVYLYSYTLSGLVKAIEYPDGRGTQTNEYDLNGRMVKTTDVGGNTQEITYNPAGMVTKKVASATGKAPITIDTTYSQYGPLTVTKTNGSNANPEMVVAYSYDENGRVKQESRSVYINSALTTATVGHVYDDAGNLRSLAVTGFSGFSRTLEYSLPYFGGSNDTTDRTTSVSCSGKEIGRLSTTYAGLKDQLWYGLSISTYYKDYDFLMRPQTIDNPSSECDYTYTYDYAGNITEWTSVGVKTSFAYDGLNRIVSCVGSSFDSDNGSYSYDIIGNQTSSPGNRSYGYVQSIASSDPTMRLSSVAVGGTTTTTSTVADDGMLGNILAISNRYTDLKYDALNRLVSITDLARDTTAQVDTYAYDPFGLRYMRTEKPVGESSTVTYYLYEENSILCEERMLSKVFRNDSINVFLGGMNIAQCKNLSGTERIYYNYLDHLGSRRAVTEYRSTPVSIIKYSIWGTPTVADANSSWYKGKRDIAYTGKVLDATGLYYFNARYYDPRMGRFLAEDPVRDGLNWYAYCGNNPVSFTDPTGLIQWPTLTGNVSSAYGERTDVPDSSLHRSVDIAAPTGTGVYAVEEGIVIGVIQGSPNSDKDAGYGNQVFVQRSDGSMDRYSHLDSICVTTMEKVDEGRMIATVGKSGYSTGSHLDYQHIKADGGTEDPVPSLGPRPTGIGLEECVSEQGNTIENKTTATSSGGSSYGYVGSGIYYYEVNLYD